MACIDQIPKVRNVNKLYFVNAMANERLFGWIHDE